MDESEVRENGIEIVDEVEVGDLSDVKEERTILPPTKMVKLRIRKATVLENKDKTYRQINASLALEDGIEVAGEVKYKGMVVWAKVCYFADPSVYTKDFFKKSQHLVELKKLATALGIDVKGIKVNDEFLAELEGKVVLADIRQKLNKFTTKDGTAVENIQNEVGNFKVAEASV